MTGPEHYKEAERLLTGDMQEIAQAQVHATLALAAATVEAAQLPRTWSVSDPTSEDGERLRGNPWHKAIHSPPVELANA